MRLAMEDIKENKKKIAQKYGEWTAHNIHLGDGVYTISEQVRGDELLARRVLQIVADVVGPLKDTRVVDLGCLEALYAVEFARHGARTLGIEIREANLAKARFVREALLLDNLDLVQDDVRNLSEAKYGSFDAVLCLGILYHLDAPDVFDFVYKMAEVCRRCLIVDTHISLTTEVSFLHDGNEYWGKVFIEHEPTATADEKEKSLWSSIDNPKSFWLTRSSLYNLLARAGFTSVYECHNPFITQNNSDRFTFLAIKGEPQEIISAPLVAKAAVGLWPEQTSEAPVQAAPVTGSKLRALGSKLPTPIKKALKKVVS